MACIFEFTSIYHNAPKLTQVSAQVGDNIYTNENIVANTLELFSSKIYDVRIGARRQARYAARRGIIAEYYESFHVSSEDLDEFTGFYRETGIMAEQLFSFGRDVSQADRRILYVRPIFIKVLQPNYVNSTEYSEKGSIYKEEAEIFVPAMIPVKKWDMLRVQDRNWIVFDKPQIIYDYRNSAVEGFKVRCLSQNPATVPY